MLDLCWVELWRTWTFKKEQRDKLRVGDRWPIWPIQVGFTAQLSLQDFEIDCSSDSLFHMCSRTWSASIFSPFSDYQLWWSESTWSLLARLPHHCLVSSASPSGSWIRRGGDFLPRSITDPDHVSIKHTAAAWLSCPNSETDSFSVLCLQIPVDLLVSVSSGGNVSWCPDSIIIVASASQLSAGHGSVKLKTVRPSSQSPSAARCCHTGIWPTKTKTCQLSAKRSNWQKVRK